MIARLLTLSILLTTAVAGAEDGRPEPAAAPDPAGLELASVHAAVADLDSGAVVYRKNAGRVVPIASITKIMTAMVVLDSNTGLDEWLEIVEREHAAPNNAYTRLRVGSQARRRDLLQVALMASENHAAYVLARHHPGGFDAFVQAMNDKARALGMDNSRFVGPSGLSLGNRSTADDLVKMIVAAADYPSIHSFTEDTRHTVRFRHPRYRLRYGNTNILAYRSRWAIGLSKTGYLDEAGRCLVMTTDIEGRPVAMVLLDSFGRRTPVGDVGRIRRWFETGESGAIAPAAQRYEQRRTAGLVAADSASGSAE